MNVTEPEVAPEAAAIPKTAPVERAKQNLPWWRRPWFPWWWRAFWSPYCCKHNWKTIDREVLRPVTSFHDKDKLTAIIFDDRRLFQSTYIHIMQCTECGKPRETVIRS